MAYEMSYHGSARTRQGTVSSVVHPPRVAETQVFGVLPASEPSSLTRDAVPIEEGKVMYTSLLVADASSIAREETARLCEEQAVECLLDAASTPVHLYHAANSRVVRGLEPCPRNYIDRAVSFAPLTFRSPVLVSDHFITDSELKNEREQLNAFSQDSPTQEEAFSEIRLRPLPLTGAAAFAHLSKLHARPLARSVESKEEDNAVLHIPSANLSFLIALAGISGTDGPTETWTFAIEDEITSDEEDIIRTESLTSRVNIIDKEIQARVKPEVYDAIVLAYDFTMMMTAIAKSQEQSSITTLIYGFLRLRGVGNVEATMMSFLAKPFMKKHDVIRTQIGSFEQLAEKFKPTKPVSEYIDDAGDLMEMFLTVRLLMLARMS